MSPFSLHDQAITVDDIQRYLPPARLYQQAIRIERNSVSVWLVNTGWSGGPPGLGSRIKLHLTRAILDAAHGGVLREAPTRANSLVGIHAVTPVSACVFASCG